MYTENDIVPANKDFYNDLKELFSGCRVSFLLGAGFSNKILGLLGNNEVIFEALRQFEPNDDYDEKIVIVLSAFLYWSFFLKSIKPIGQISVSDTCFEPYNEFGDNLYRIFSERGNPVLDRQFNIFTTNYDPIIELIFDRSNCICNDGFEGRIMPIFSTDNYAKSYYRQAVFSNRKSEIPSLNLIKLHGSVTWDCKVGKNKILYKDYDSAISQFIDSYSSLFDEELMSEIDDSFSDRNTNGVLEEINNIIFLGTLDPLLSDVREYENFIDAYKREFAIVNPTKEKFSDTLLNKNYYELLRLFSNELEKENSLLVVYGFSLRDEHILDILKRSMVNPTLKLLIFCYSEKSITEYKSLLDTPKNDNITYISLSDEKLSLENFNQILSHIHA